NLRHWDDAKRGVYEVWYATWNHPGTDQGFWLRYVIEAPLAREPYGELWFARFDPKGRTFGIHKRFHDVGSQSGPFSLTIGGARLGHDHAFGELAGDGHSVRWDLRWEPASHALRLLPDVMYAG